VAGAFVLWQSRQHEVGRTNRDSRRKFHHPPRVPAWDRSAKISCPEQNTRHRSERRAGNENEFRFSDGMYHKRKIMTTLNQYLRRVQWAVAALAMAAPLLQFGRQHQRLSEGDSPNVLLERVRPITNSTAGSGP